MSYNPNPENSRQLQSGYTNGSGLTIALAAPVSSNGTQMLLTDVSSETSSLAFIGLTSVSTPSAANGTVVSGGRLENVVTGFAVGSPLWVGSTPGTLTNIQPNDGSNGFVSGDFVIFVGVVVQNEFNPAEQDIQILTQIIGQL